MGNSSSTGLNKPDKTNEKEFNHLVSILDFNNRAHDYFKRWYIDGRISFGIVNFASRT